MTAVLRKLPIQVEPDEVHCGLERISIKSYQIIVYMSITNREVVDLPPLASRLPAILDTGHNHNFSIDWQHLTKWAMLSRDQLPLRRNMPGNEGKAPFHRAKVWIHPNEPGQRDKLAGLPPFPLELREGIAVHLGTDSPRLPLLGLRALMQNGLLLMMDSKRRAVDLHTEGWRTKLLRWLA
jgi:hypothetical protein